MANIRRCYNENCECNIDGVYCCGIDIVIGTDGCCEDFVPKKSNDGNDGERREGE